MTLRRARYTCAGFAIVLALILSLLAGCGGGGSAASLGSGGSGSVTIHLPATQRPRLPRVIPSTTASFVIHVFAVGTTQDLVPAVTVTVGNTVVTINNVPAGPVTVEVDALDANGKVVATGSATTTVTSGGTTDITITLVAVGTSPSPSPSSSPSSSPSPSPRLYVANSFDDTLSVIDVNTLTPLASPAIDLSSAATNPVSVAVNRAGTKVWVLFAPVASTATPSPLPAIASVDTTTNAVSSPIPFGSGGDVPQLLRASKTADLMFATVQLSGGDYIVAFDSNTGAVQGNITPLGTGAGRVNTPVTSSHGLTVGSDGSVYVTYRDSASPTPTSYLDQVDANPADANFLQSLFTAKAGPPNLGGATVGPVSGSCSDGQFFGAYIDVNSANTQGILTFRGPGSFPFSADLNSFILPLSSPSPINPCNADATVRNGIKYISSNEVITAVPGIPQCFAPPPAHVSVVPPGDALIEFNMTDSSYTPDSSVPSIDTGSRNDLLVEIAISPDGKLAFVTDDINFNNGAKTGGIFVVDLTTKALSTNANLSNGFLTTGNNPIGLDIKP